ncbi:transcriptional regulator [Cardiobacterium sp. AH-315-I02]|nr:transcriptional regulator [Cardiobacterium sp. AH-315-I02]
MEHLTFLTEVDVQLNLTRHLQKLRKKSKLSRDSMAEKSTVPSSTIKKFETTGQISLRQFLLLWQSLDDLNKINNLTKTTNNSQPRTIDEVLNGEFS